MKKFKKLIIAAGVFIVIFGMGYVFSEISSLSQVNKERAMAIKIAAAEGNVALRQLEKSLYYLQFFSEYMGHGAIVKREFDKVANDFVKKHKSIKTFLVAPRGVVKYVYPLKDNEQLVGNNLLNSSAHQNTVLSAIQTRRMHLSNSSVLSRKNAEVIIYTPIFISREFDDNSFWGFGIAVIDISEIIKNSNARLLADYEFNLSFIPKYQNNEIILAKSLQLPQTPVHFETEAFHGKWILAISPKDGWLLKKGVSPNIIFLLITSLVTSLIIFSLLKQKEAEDIILSQNYNLEKKNSELGNIKNYLDNIINSMPSVLIGIDYENRVTHWNINAEKLADIKGSHAIGQAVWDVFPMLSGQLSEITEALQNRIPQKLEKIESQLNNKQQYLNITIFPLIANELKGAVILIDDITDRVRLEEMIVQTEKMISVGGLAAGMAHEINNPLSSILQASQNFARRMSPDLPKNVEIARECGLELEAMHTYLKKRNILEYLNFMQEASKRAARIISNMLQFSRRSEHKRIATNLHELINKIIELASTDFELQKKYDFRHIEIIKEFDENLTDIPCVAIEIEQVILNLLKNAAQAMYINENQTESPQITIRTVLEDQNARIEVEDNGPGMDDEIRKRIFEPFFTTKETGAGTGLGLAVSFFIVTNSHKGSISVESKPGVGTKFIIHLSLE